MVYNYKRDEITCTHFYRKRIHVTDKSIIDLIIAEVKKNIGYALKD